MEMIMKKSILPLCVALIALLFIGCGAQGSADKGDLAQRKIKIVTTTGMIADAVKNVGGERVDVVALMGPGVDPHLYKASAGDVSRMSSADIIFYNGLHLEGKMTEIFEKMQRFAKVYAIADGVDEKLLERTSAFAGNYDPHIWFDVKLWMQVVKYIAKCLSEVDPQSAEIYQANMTAYLAKLQELDQYVRDQAATIPEQHRILITAHDAFHYFGKAYGFQVRGLQGISTVAETGTADVQQLADFIVKHKVPAIFVETSVPPRYIEALQAAVKSRGFDVKIGGTLFSDAMGDPGTPEGEYLGMVKHNIDTIVKAFKANETA
jgi:manganese/zinc/iron transport system substrate-binding protein